jgi:hypothetical protein
VFFPVFLHFIKNEPVPMRDKSFGTGFIVICGYERALPSCTIFRMIIISSHQGKFMVTLAGMTAEQAIEAAQRISA